LISRFYLEDYLSFKQIDIEFNKGLIVFSGASGAGKSILFDAILSLFGQSEAKTKLSEIELEDLNLKDELYDINTTDDIIIKQSTTSKTRYFLNNQTISKKNLAQFTKPFFKYLHLKDTSDFQSDKIIEFLDFLAIKNDKQYNDILKNFNEDFQTLKNLQIQYNKIKKDEEDIENLKEFCQFEIDKIEQINPQIGEYDELKSLKDTFLKKDKLESALNDAKPFLNNAHLVSKALNIIDINSEFFDDTINEVNSIFEKFYDSILNIDDNDIEKTLDRIEQLSKLQKKYGSIEEAIEYKNQKIKELEQYENISFEKAILEKNIKKLQNSIDEQVKTLTSYRQKAMQIFQNDINRYLKDLYLSDVKLNILEKPLDKTGKDKIEFYLNNTPLSKISSGEFNRLRLALLTARSIYEIDNSGILFLDEIDANLSGKESESIAKVLNILSKNYQIFAISHQPQLSATATQHFLVEKNNNISIVKELQDDEKINEIARMISGENITKEAISFAHTIQQN